MISTSEKALSNTSEASHEDASQPSSQVHRIHPQNKHTDRYYKTPFVSDSFFLLGLSHSLCAMWPGSDIRRYSSLNAQRSVFLEFQSRWSSRSSGPMPVPQFLLASRFDIFSIYVFKFICSKLTCSFDYCVPIFNRVRTLLSL